MRFGRKKELKEEVTDSRSNVDRSYANGVSNANGSAMNSSDLAVYEQFERQVGFVVPRLDFVYMSRFCIACIYWHQVNDI